MAFDCAYGPFEFENVALKSLTLKIFWSPEPEVDFTINAVPFSPPTSAVCKLVAFSFVKEDVQDK